MKPSYEITEARFLELREKAFSFGTYMDEFFNATFPLHEDLERTARFNEKLESFRDDFRPGDVIALIMYYEKKLTKIEAEVFHHALIKHTIEATVKEMLKK